LSKLAFLAGKLKSWFLEVPKRIKGLRIVFSGVAEGGRKRELIAETA
jgi:hypothetical protein